MTSARLTPSGTIIDAGVDYITLTASQNSSSNVMLMKAHVLGAREARLGNEICPWSGFGYHGFRVGQVQFGERPDGAIVRLSGDTANDEWWDFYQAADSTTRVDLQATVRLNHDTQVAIKRHYTQAKRFWSKRRDGPTLTLISDNRGGSTFYLGKRQSKCMMRIYAKDAESKLDHYQNCVRYELELKDEFARRYLADLTDGRLVQSTIVSSLNQYAAQRGVRPWFPPNLETPIKVGVVKRNTTCDRKLQWLETQVRPSVQFLLQWFTAREIAECVGLPWCEVIKSPLSEQSDELIDHTKE